MTINVWGEVNQWLGGGGVISIPFSSSLCSYISNGVNLDLTGEIQVSLSVTSQAYTPIDLILTQTPEIKVNLDNSSYSYSSIGASFELSGLAL